jgi:hypothetical protein
VYYPPEQTGRPRVRAVVGGVVAAVLVGFWLVGLRWSIGQSWETGLDYLGSTFEAINVFLK